MTSSKFCRKKTKVICIPGLVPSVVVVVDGTTLTIWEPADAVMFCFTFLQLTLAKAPPLSAA